MDKENGGTWGSLNSIIMYMTVSSFIHPFSIRMFLPNSSLFQRMPYKSSFSYNCPNLINNVLIIGLKEVKDRKKAADRERREAQLRRFLAQLHRFRRFLAQLGRRSRRRGQP